MFININYNTDSVRILVWVLCNHLILLSPFRFVKLQLADFTDTIKLMRYA